MKTKQIIENCNQIKPNMYDRQLMEAWILELEQKIVAEIWNRSEEYKEMNIPEEANEELLVKPPYENLYMYWLFMKIDFFNDELDRYNNDAILFNSEYADYAAYFRRNHMPADS